MNRNNKKIVRLTESDLVRIVRRVIKEEYVYTAYDLKDELEKMGFDVTVTSKGGSQYVDDRYVDDYGNLQMYSREDYDVTVNNVDDISKVIEFIRKKDVGSIKTGDNSINFNFSVTRKM